MHGLGVLGVVLLCSFALLAFVPGDAARQVAGPRASEERVEQIRRQLGLDQNVFVQMWRYLGRLVRGDFGTTANGSARVGALMRENAPVTIWLLVGSLLLTAIGSLLLAVAAVRRPGGFVDRLVVVSGTVGLALPSFWLGIVLLIAVARPTGWFPIGGWGETWGEQLRAIVLPCVTLAISLIPIITRSLRTSMLEVLSSDYIAAGRSVGLRGWGLFRHFVLRNALVPSVALFASMTGAVLSGTVLVEATFGLPGLGQMMVSGAVNRDLNIVQGLTVVFAFGVVAANIVGDLVVAALDPRIGTR